MAIDCPNKGHADWKRLVESLKKDHGDKAEDMAEVAFHRAGEIPTPERARELLGNRAGVMAKARQVVREFSQEAWDGLKKAWYPEGRSTVAEQTATWMREQIGRYGIAKERSLRTLDANIRKMHEQDSAFAMSMDRMAAIGKTAADVFFRGQSDFSNKAFMQWMDTGEAPKGWKPTAEHEAIANVIRDMDAQKVKAIQDLGTGKLEHVRESYFPHQWTAASRRAFSRAIGEAFKKFGDKEPRDLNEWSDEAKEWVRNRVQEIRSGAEGTGEFEDKTSLAMSKRPWLKTPGSLKKRVFEDFNTGQEFGLEPVTMNPLDAKASQWAAMDRYIASHNVKDALKSVGAAKYVPLGGEKPSGMIPMSNGEVFAPPAEGGFGPQLAGHWYVDSTAGQVIENYLSKGLWGNVGFKAYMGAAGTLNQFQLGVVSAFHAGFTSMEAMISKGAMGIKAAAEGNFKEAGKHFLGVPAEVVANWKRGDAVIKALAGDKTAPTWANKVIEWMELAGASTMQDRRLQTNMTDIAFKAAKEGQYGKAAAASPFAFVEQTTRPIMEWLVPRQKIGVFAEMMNSWVEKNKDRLAEAEKTNKGITHEETMRQAQQAWNRVDSRLGQVVYDRLFIDNTAKNITQMLVRAPGWTGGTLLEVGGGLLDIGKYMKDQATRPGMAKLSDRGAYTVSLIVTTAVANSLLTALFTGEHPDEHDILAFRTGEKDEHGNPIRFMLPTYMKDLYAYMHEPAKTLTNKAHPMISLLADLEKNRDYYGTEIRHNGDPLIDQIGDMAGYTIKAFQPFWTRGIQQVNQRQGSTLEKVLPAIGVMPAPSAMTMTPAQKAARDLQVDRTQTKEQFDRKQIKKRVEIAAEKEGPKAVQQAVRSGEIGTETGKQILKDIRTAPIIRATQGMDAKALLEVWDKASEEERRLLRPRIIMSAMRYRNTHSAEDTSDMKTAMRKRGL